MKLCPLLPKGTVFFLNNMPSPLCRLAQPLLDFSPNLTFYKKNYAEKVSVSFLV